MGRDDDLGYIALDDAARPAGAAWVRYLPLNHSASTTEYAPFPELAIAVLPDYSNRGIGTRLLHLLLDDARSVYPAVELSVRSTNPARRLYERLGFVVVDEVTNRVGGTSYVMRITFQSSEQTHAVGPHVPCTSP